MQGWFLSKLGVKKSVMDPTSCQHNFLHHQQPKGHNKQESTTFIHPYGSNKQHCMDKKEFHWVFGVLQGWFSVKLGVKKSVMDPSCKHHFLGHQQPQGHNKQESTTFILPYGSNKQICMDKVEFHWVFGVLRRVGFHQNLGSKISDGSQLSAQLPSSPTATET
jgi:hypothetical protein